MFKVLFILILIFLEKNIFCAFLLEGSIVTTLSFKEISSSGSSNSSEENYHHTFALPFRLGEIDPLTQTISLYDPLTNKLVFTQVDEKKYHNETDGTKSLRHAVITVHFPELFFGDEKNYEVVVVKKTDYQEMIKDMANKDGLTIEEVKQSGAESVITLDGISGSQQSGKIRMVLSDVLNEVDNPSKDVKYWLKGPLVTEIIVKKRYTEMLSAVWEVRVYHAGNKVRISNTVENVNCLKRGNIGYSVQITGYHSTVLYSKTPFTHYHSARWRKVLWEEPYLLDVELHFDLDYLIFTKHLLNYDTSIQLENKNKFVPNENFDIMGNGNIMKYFPTTGGRGDLGIIPSWCVYYLYTFRNDLKERCFTNGELSGGIPIHYEERDENRPSFNKVVTIDDRPTVWLSWWDYTWQNSEDKLPAPVGETSTMWHVDDAHQPSLCYVPYLLSGDFYFLQEMMYWSSFNLGASNHDYRQDERGIFQGQVRAVAWTGRTLAQTTAMVPDSPEFTLERLYFENKMANNAYHWNYEKVNTHPLKSWGWIKENRGTPDVTHVASSWMDDFVMEMLKHAEELNFGTKVAIDWFSSYLLNRFDISKSNGYDPYYGAPYRIPMKYCTDYPTPCTTYVDVPDWATCLTKFDSVMNSFDGNAPDSYHFIALGCLGMISEFYPAAETAYTWLYNEVDKSRWDESPVYLFVSRPCNFIRAVDERDPDPFPKPNKNFELVLPSKTWIFVLGGVLGGLIALIIFIIVIVIMCLVVFKKGKLSKPFRVESDTSKLIDSKVEMTEDIKSKSQF